MTVGRSLLAGLAVSAMLAPSPTSAAQDAPTGPDVPQVALQLEVSESGPDEQWKVRISNASSAPVRLVSDPLLVWLEVSLPGQAKPRLCKLPADLVPKGGGGFPSRSPLLLL